MDQSTKFITLKMPKTDWREPSRAHDDLLKVPRGPSLTPTDEVHESVPIEKALRGQAVERSASVVFEHGSHIERVWGRKDESSAEKQGGETPSEMGSKAAVNSLDGMTDEITDYEGDAEYGSEQVTDTSSVVPNEATKGVSGTEDIFDKLPAGDQRDFDNEFEFTPALSSTATSTLTYPRPVRPSKHRPKALRQGTESIRPHPSDPTKIIVTYEVKDAAGRLYVQETDVPKVLSTPTTSPKSSESIIVPDLEASKVPRVKKSLPWRSVHGTSGYEWIRGEGDKKETWRINVFFRRLDRDTHVYQDIYINVNFLNNVDPNNKTFRTAYNKWVLQIARRSDASYTQQLVRVHWTTDERRALFNAINAFCFKSGIHRFGFVDPCTLDTEQLQIIANAVNAAPNPLRTEPRGVDAVRGQIVSAHNKTPPKNKPIFDLLVLGADFRARMAAGEEIPREKRKPRAAISIAQFPMDSPVGTADPSTARSRKRKLVAVVRDAEPSSSELSSPTASEAGGEHSFGEDRQSEGSGERDRLGNGDEVVIGEGGQWAEAKGEVSFPQSKRARRA